MIDSLRTEQWAKDARAALMQHYGKNDTAAHLGAIVVALLADREERECYCSRLSRLQPRQS
jgi:hypothetical protein